MKKSFLLLIAISSFQLFAQNGHLQNPLTFQYPSEAVDKYLEGTTIIEFSLDEEFQLKETKLIQSESAFFSNEVIQELKNNSLNLEKNELMANQKYQLIVCFNLYESSHSEDFFTKKSMHLKNKSNYSKALKIADKGIERFPYCSRLHLIRSQLYDCLRLSDLAAVEMNQYKKLENVLDVIYVYHKTIQKKELNSFQKKLQLKK